MKTVLIRRSKEAVYSRIGDLLLLLLVIIGLSILLAGETGKSPVAAYIWGRRDTGMLAAYCVGLLAAAAAQIYTAVRLVGTLRAPAVRLSFDDEGLYVAVRGGERFIPYAAIVRVIQTSAHSWADSAGTITLRLSDGGDVELPDIEQVDVVKEQIVELKTAYRLGWPPTGLADLTEPAGRT